MYICLAYIEIWLHVVTPADLKFSYTQVSSYYEIGVLVLYTNIYFHEGMFSYCKCVGGGSIVTTVTEAVVVVVANITRDSCCCCHGN